MTVLYLDPYFLGDPLFLGGFARDVAARSAAPLVIVHGSGEAGERALEALGEVAHAADGVWVATDARGRAAVERATRELGRRVVHELNEAGVAAVRVAGEDRGLLKSDGDGLRAGRTGWLRTLALQGAVPVVASLVDREGETVEADPAAAAARLAEALGAGVVALLTGRAPSVQTADGPVRELAPAALDGLRGLPDADAVRRIIAAGQDVRLTSLAGFRAAEAEPGTLVSARFEG